MYVGKKVTRVDAYDKVIGRTRYCKNPAFNGCKRTRRVDRRF